MATDVSLAKVVPLQGASWPPISNFVLALVSAFLLILSFPNFELNLLAWVALAPLMLALTRVKSLWRACLLGEITGSIFFYGTSHFIGFSISNYGGINPVLTYIIVAIPCLAVGLFHALFAGITARCLRKFGLWAIFAAPFIWTAIEYVRCVIFRVGWDSLGYSQAFHPYLIQISNIGGIYIVSFFVVLINAALVFVSLTDSSRDGIIVALLSIALLGANYEYGRRWQWQSTGDGPYRVVAIQPNVPMDGDGSQIFIKRVLDQHIEMSEKAIAEFRNAKVDGDNTKPIVVIWPESPMNMPYNAEVELREQVSAFAKRNNVYLIWNTIVDMPDKRDLNSVLVMSPNGEKTSQYDKIYLMPFGEYVPFRNWIPFIGRIPALAGEFTAGNEYRLSTVDGARLGASICYEATIPQVARNQAKEGATVLVNISDDGWFGPTAAARQHLAHAVFRSVENNRETLRVTNSGITVRIRPDGNFDDQTDLFQTAVRKWRVDLATERPKTVYTLHGDFFAVVCAIASVIFLAASFIKKTPQEAWKSKIADDSPVE